MACVLVGEGFAALLLDGKKTNFTVMRFLESVKDEFINLHFVLFIICLKFIENRPLKLSHICSANACTNHPHHPPPLITLGRITMPSGNIKIIAGTRNRELAESIAKRLGLQLEKCTVVKFANQETS